jgi:hypothetical protein
MSEPLRPHRPFDAHSLDYHKGKRCVSASAVCLSLEMHSVHRRLIAVAWHDGLVSGKLIRQKGRDRRRPLACWRLASLQRASYCPFPRQTALTSRFSRRPAEPRVSSPCWKGAACGNALAPAARHRCHSTGARRHLHVLELSTTSCHIPISYPAHLPCS